MAKAPTEELWHILTVATENFHSGLDTEVLAQIQCARVNDEAAAMKITTRYKVVNRDSSPFNK